MSATLDATVLLYASDESSPFHARAIGFVNEIAYGPELVYLFWPTVMAYLRVATHPAVFATPLSAAAAVANIDNLLHLPHVLTVGEQDRFWQTYGEIVSEVAPAGNLVPDARLVALMRENGVRTIWTNDRDYRRFDGIRVRDPFRS